MKLQRKYKNWDNFFFALVDTVAGMSKDKSTQVGCVIVGTMNEIKSTGFNGMPIRVDDTPVDRHERPKKYLYVEHAERNAIYLATRGGVCLVGCKLYVGWLPCADCARGIIQSGIAAVHIATSDVPKRWEESARASYEMFSEAGVKVIVGENGVNVCNVCNVCGEEFEKVFKITD